jgi:hypothetical protein
VALFHDAGTAMLRGRSTIGAFLMTSTRAGQKFD